MLIFLINFYRQRLVLKTSGFADLVLSKKGELNIFFQARLEEFCRKGHVDSSKKTFLNQEPFTCVVEAKLPLDLVLSVIQPHFLLCSFQVYAKPVF